MALGLRHAEGLEGGRAVATIYEVAARAGVSPATVSRVLNGATTVSPDKVELVLSAAQELAFTPNRTARSLRRRTSDVIALIIPDVANPFFTSLARGVEDGASAAGHSVVLCNSDDDVAKEARYIDIAVSENMAGVIIAAASPTSDVGPLLRRHRAVVAVDRTLPRVSVDAVVLDDAVATARLTRRLRARGHRRIGCITGPASTTTTVERVRGWREAAGLAEPVGTALLRHADNRPAGGERALHDLLEIGRPPDAVVVTNNLMAVGALRALDERGLSPREFGVACFGELPYLTSAPPPVDMLEVPARELGLTAAALLMERARGATGPVRTVVLDPTVRETSTPPAGAGSVM